MNFPGIILHFEGCDIIPRPLYSHPSIVAAISDDPSLSDNENAWPFNKYDAYHVARDHVSKYRDIVHRSQHIGLPRGHGVGRMHFI